MLNTPRDKDLVMVVFGGKGELCHYEPKQIRQQAGQNLWQIWAQLAIAHKLTDDVDKARIRINDLNGNEVGGSRMWGGSLIWVDD